MNPQLERKKPSGDTAPASLCIRRRSALLTVKSPWKCPFVTRSWCTIHPQEIQSRPN